MAIYRSVQMSFWTDPKISDTFSTDEKLLYLYLLTNPHTNLCGCYEVSMKQIAFEAGFTAQQTVKLMSSLMEKRVINYDENTREVLLINWSKYNWTESEKFRKPLKAEIKKVRTEKFRTYLEHLAYGIDTGSDSDGYGMDTVSVPYRYPMDTETDSDGYGMDTTVTVTVTNTVSNSVNKRGDARGEIIKNSSLSEPVKDKVIDFLAYRDEIKKPYKSERGIKSLITQIEKQEQAIGSMAVISVIDTSMQNGWQGLFWDKAPKKQNHSSADMAEIARLMDEGVI